MGMENKEGWGENPQNFSDVTPPFFPGEEILCIHESPDVDFFGNEIEMCFCTHGQTYTIDGCIWSYACGWLVSITHELHKVEDFKKRD